MVSTSRLIFVAVDMAASMTTGPDDALKAAPCLSASLAQLEGVHGAHQPDLKLRYIAFGDRADFDAVEPQILEEGRDIGL